jgi:hypothetical protein
MSRVFVSYAAADEDFVNRLVERLKESGHTVYFSGGSLQIGQKWQDSLSSWLREADAIVIVISEASSGSRWLMTELGAALGYFQERGQPVILPVVIDESPLPVQLSQIQALFARNKDLDWIVPRLTGTLDAIVGRAQARTEEKREVQARIERHAAEYIKESLSDLREKEKVYKRIAYLWYSAALLALLGGVSFALWRALISAATQPTWISIVHLAVASVLVIGLLGALSRFAFILGKSFMVESLRNGDRIHAISFGEFYLKTFPEKAEWAEIKEAFQHWNIDSGSSFITQNATDIDPQILQTAIEVAKAIVGKAKGKD